MEKDEVEDVIEEDGLEEEEEEEEKESMFGNPRR